MKNHNGYQSAEYGEAFRQLGTVLLGERTEGLFLLRDIPGSFFSDLINLYPFFSTPSQEGLDYDLNYIWNVFNPVSLVLVSNPIQPLNFNSFDLIKPFKTHFLVNLGSPTHFSENHRRNIKKFPGKIEQDNPGNLIQEFHILYQNLIERHKILGITSFTEKQHAHMLQTPGAIALKATVHNKTSGIMVFYEQDFNLYYHLSAYNEEGYHNSSSFALMNYAIQLFKDKGYKKLVLGSSSGFVNQDDGLARFKRGWSNESVTNYIGLKIFDKEAYNFLSQHKNTDFWPTYRG